MNFVEVVKKAKETGKWFHLPDDVYLYIGKDGTIRYADICNNKPATFSTKEILSNEWQLKEEWYDNFREKYPKGLLCTVWDMCNPTEKYIRLVIDYINGRFRILDSLDLCEGENIYYWYDKAKPIEENICG